MDPVMPAMFLSALYATAPLDRVLRCELRAVWPVRDQRPIRRQFFDLPGSCDPAPISNWASAWNSCGYNLFYGVNPRFADGGKAEFVAGVVALPLDYDSIELGQRALRRLVEVGLAPNIVVASGRGYHAYLLLNTVADCAAARAVGRRLCYWTDSDSVFDAPRTMRLPGTVNQKRETSGAVATVVHFRPEPRYSLAEITSRLDVAGAPIPDPEKRERRLRARPVASSVIAPVAAPVASPVVAPVAPRVVPAPRPPTPSVPPRVPVPETPEQQAHRAKLWAWLPERIQDLIITGVYDHDKYQSRSEADLAVVRALVNAGASDDDIVEIFEQYPAGIGERTAERGLHYLQHTIDTARDTANSVDISIVQFRCRVPYDGEAARALLRLRVVKGPGLGAEFTHGIALGRKGDEVWRYLFMAAGLSPPPERRRKELRALVGRRAHAELAEGPYGMEVRRWLPPWMDP
jgi:hypothetical protein